MSAGWRREFSRRVRSAVRPSCDVLPGPRDRMLDLVIQHVQKSPTGLCKSTHAHARAYGSSSYSQFDTLVLDTAPVCPCIVGSADTGWGSAVSR
jgi:hypothetical protein